VWRQQMRHMEVRGCGRRLATAAAAADVKLLARRWRMRLNLRLPLQIQHMPAALRSWHVPV
jgi:hypothetical protein